MSSPVGKPLISVIIPFHGNSKVIASCLAGLKSQTTDILYEVVVVDNGNEFSLSELLPLEENVRIELSSTRMLPGVARNRGVEVASADMLAFLDADCIPCARWIDRIHNRLNSGIEIVLGPMVNANYFQPIATSDNLLQFVDFQAFQSKENVSHFPGCNFGMKKTLYEEIGGYPPHVKMGQDVVFSQRALHPSKGSLFYDRKLIIWHKGRNQFNEFVRHQHAFGLARSTYNLKVSSFLKKVPNLHLRAGFAGLRRLAYIGVRTLQWNPLGFIFLLLYSPMILIGLVAWSIGFYRGSIYKNEQ